MAVDFDLCEVLNPRGNSFQFRFYVTRLRVRFVEGGEPVERVFFVAGKAAERNSKLVAELCGSSVFEVVEAERLYLRWKGEACSLLSSGLGDVGPV